MSKYAINDTTLTAIADSIRAKGGTSDPIQVSNFASAIANLPSGGGLPPEAFVITGDCSYRFAYGGWDWFLENYANKITMENVTSSRNMFTYSKMTQIPIEINVSGGSTFSMFNNSDVEHLDGLKLNNIGDCSYMFSSCNYLRSVSFDSISFSNSDEQRSNMFNNCYSLRSLPSNLFDNMIFPISSYLYYNAFYTGLCSYCYSIDEIKNLPVTDSTYDYDAFSSMVYSCGRLKSCTFKTNADGSAKTAKLKSQTLDFSSYVGYISSSYNKSYVLNYNSGITADKEVTDDATYQALKNDPDWFTTKIEYSRYNHDSAVETINSLPDTSAYLATAGGTNTIKFKGAAGALTDGGAINTLTEEEIAVAAAKGWTVSLV